MKLFDLFRSRPEPWWETFPAEGEQTEPLLTEEQRSFIIRQLDANPGVSRREKKRILRRDESAREAGHVRIADKMLNMTLSIEGYNVERIARDPEYWRKFRALFLDPSYTRMDFLQER